MAKFKVSMSNDYFILKIPFFKNSQIFYSLNFWAKGGGGGGGGGNQKLKKIKGKIIKN
jgi:hypothetical protein